MGEGQGVAHLPYAGPTSVIRDVRTQQTQLDQAEVRQRVQDDHGLDG